MRYIKKTIKFDIKIPQELYRYRWSNVKKYFKFHMHRPKCSCCGAKLVFRNPEYYTTIKGTRLIVSYHSDKFETQLCAVCLVKKFSEDPYTGKLQEWDVSNKCDCCGIENLSVRFYHTKEDVLAGKHDRLHFCINSWNSSNICSDCVIIALTEGMQKSSIYCLGPNGNSIPQNEYGLPVVDGKVKFPYY